MQFWIDVGGTFTDCLGCWPDGRVETCKVLSSGSMPAAVSKIRSPRELVCPAADSRTADFWRSYGCEFVDENGTVQTRGRIVSSSPDGVIELSADVLGSVAAGQAVRLTSPEDAPLFAIRRLLGLRLSEALPRCEVRLGTTRGTNALLERKGAKVAFVTTKGFADLLRIGTQARPALFDLNIRKPDELYRSSIAIDERIAADGTILSAADEGETRRLLLELRDRDIESLAVCLLHAHLNPSHEELVERVAHEVGFNEVSVSHRVASSIGAVARGSTTVVAAYLDPVMRGYVESLQSALGDSVLRIMTSAGGLVAASDFSGKDSLLSGPAGGVVGYSRTAQHAGFAKSIGFDMGGTSTDVSRFDGRLERRFESEIAGVRVVTPTLDIETVAAGGGSICRFDGVRLLVGPESASADPGPACYGKGGPLTVTDVNLLLGRIVPEEFPFPLDRQAAVSRTEELLAELPPTNSGIADILQLAEGLRRIANSAMAHAIRRISTARGFDPRSYVLTTFGGAGGQHACELAEELGMQQVLIHPHAGILSALGMGLADSRRLAEQVVLKPCDRQTLDELQHEFRRLENRCTEELLAEGIAGERIESIRSLDLRYVGEESPINVELPPDGDVIRDYEAAHERLYGYRREGRAVQVVTARVEAIGRSSYHPLEPVQADVVTPQAEQTQSLYQHGRTWTAGRFRYDTLTPGAQVIGPAVVTLPTSTVVVDPGWQADVGGRGELILARTEVASDESTHVATIGRDPDGDLPVTDASEVDPVTLEIFNNQFASIAEQMGETLRRTALSTNVKERLDFSCALFDAAGRLVANAPHIPVHLGAMGQTVRRILGDNPDLAPGDVYVTNDPYRGGSHLPDVTVVSPIHDPFGQLRAFTASRAHHAEIGGITPGSMPPFSTNLAEEGVLIRNFRLIRAGRSRESELRSLLQSGPYSSRNVDENLADIAAQVAANRRGASQFLELLENAGQPQVARFMQAVREAAVRKVRAALERIGRGTYQFADRLDNGAVIRVRIDISDQGARIDFTGTDGVLPSNLNANRAIVSAAVMYVVRCLIAEDIPLNDGVLEPIEIVVPECLLHPPEHDDPRQCAAIVGGNVETSQRVVDVLLGALGVQAASQGTMNNLTFGDASFGYYETICGGAGATEASPGADAVHTHMTNTRLTDVEVLEHRYPVRVERFAIRCGSGGAGRHRGGDGVIRQLRFLRAVDVSLLTQRRTCAPFGLNGGEPGAPGRNTLLRCNRQPQQVDGVTLLHLHPGDQLVIETPGGGGYGNP